MPWLSKAQQRWGHTPSGAKALGGAAKVAEWDGATDFSKLKPRGKAPKGPTSIGALMRSLK